MEKKAKCTTKNDSGSSLRQSTNSSLSNISVLIKEVDKVISESKRKDVPEKYKNKKYLGRDESGHYIM